MANEGSDWLLSRRTALLSPLALMSLSDHLVAAANPLVAGENRQHWASTIYPGPKNNFVFSASTVWWNQGLSSPPGHVLQWYHGVRCHGPDPRVQCITHNLLRRALE